jgi:glycine dehydrogenase
MIYAEIKDIEENRMKLEESPLRNAPHSATLVCSDDWNKPYSREAATLPTEWTRKNKFWPAVSRINNPHGDRNFVCRHPETTSQV